MNSSPSPIPVKESISPVKAIEYLKTQVINRPLSQSRVLEFAIEMDEGRWVVNGETIKFDNKGNLFDGQHRLEACILANRSFITYVVRGIEDVRAFSTVDIGKTRSPGDLLALQGFTDQNNAAACAAILYLWKNNRLVSLPGPKGIERSQHVCDLVRKTSFKNVVLPRGTTHIPKEVLVAFADQYKHKIIEALKTVNNQGLSKLAPRSLWAATLILFSEKDASAALKFLGEVGSGEGLLKGDPAYSLRNKLQDLKFSRVSRPNKWVLFLLILKAWLAFRTGKRILQMKVAEKEAFPAIR